MARKSYTAKFKVQVVFESLASNKTDAEVARAYGIHPITLVSWRKTLQENGDKAFDGDNTVKEYEKRLADLERLLGRKEVEIALLKNFLGGN